MKLRDRLYFPGLLLIGAVLRFIAFGFLIYDSLFRMCYAPAFQGDYGIFALIVNIYQFFDEAGKWVYFLGCSFFPLVIVGSNLWLRTCKKALPDVRLTKFVYYLSVFVLGTGLAVFIAGAAINDFKVEIVLRSVFIAVIALFLIFDIWNTVLVSVKYRNSN